MIHKCKDNDTVLHFITNDEGIEEILVKSIGDKSWTVIGYNDLQKGISEVEQKCNRKEIKPIHNYSKSLYTRTDIIHAYTLGHNHGRSGITHSNGLILFKENHIKDEK